MAWRVVAALAAWRVAAALAVRRVAAALAARRVTTVVVAARGADAGEALMVATMETVTVRTVAAAAAAMATIVADAAQPLELLVQLDYLIRWNLYGVEMGWTDLLWQSACNIPC